MKTFCFGGMDENGISIQEKKKCGRKPKKLLPPPSSKKIYRVRNPQLPTKLKNDN
jgi:hypothetical protein